jgi:hypothetical protein
MVLESNGYECTGSKRMRAVLLSIIPSDTMSTAIFTCACAVRFPLRVCKMYLMVLWWCHADFMQL